MPQTYYLRTCAWSAAARQPHCHQNAVLFSTVMWSRQSGQPSAKEASSGLMLITPWLPRCLSGQQRSDLAAIWSAAVGCSLNNRLVIAPVKERSHARWGRLRLQCKAGRRYAVRVPHRRASRLKEFLDHRRIKNVTVWCTDESHEYHISHRVGRGCFTSSMSVAAAKYYRSDWARKAWDILVTHVLSQPWDGACSCGLPAATPKHHGRLHHAVSEFDPAFERSQTHSFQRARKTNQDLLCLVVTVGDDR